MNIYIADALLRMPNDSVQVVELRIEDDDALFNANDAGAPPRLLINGVETAYDYSKTGVGRAYHHSLTGGGSGPLAFSDCPAIALTNGNYLLLGAAGMDPAAIAADPIGFRLDEPGAQSDLDYINDLGMPFENDPDPGDSSFDLGFLTQDFDAGGGEDTITVDYSGLSPLTNAPGGRLDVSVASNGDLVFGIDGEAYNISNTEHLIIDAAPAAGIDLDVNILSTLSIMGSGVGDVILGGNGDDTLSAGSGRDKLYGNNGDDWLSGDKGRDALHGGSGNDTLLGGNDDDNLRGDGGDDILIGGNGNDSLRAAAGNDDLRGGNGVDRMLAGGGSDKLSGGAGADYMEGNNGNDILAGGSGDDTLYGDHRSGRNLGNGHDTLSGGSGADYIDGGAGVDTITFGGPTGVSVDLLRGAGSGGQAEGDTYRNIENVIGTRHGDTLAGNDSANVLDGGKGDDGLLGDGGADRLIGGEGDDAMDGGAGADTFVFLADHGDDTILGFETGADTVAFDIGGLTFSDLNIFNNADGDAVADYGSGTITFIDVATADLSASDFDFA